MWIACWATGNSDGAHIHLEVHKTNIVGCDDSLRAKVLIIEDGKNEKNPNDKLDNGLSWSGAYQRTIINPFNHGEKYVKN